MGLCKGYIGVIQGLYRGLEKGLHRGYVVLCRGHSLTALFSSESKEPHMLQQATPKKNKSAWQTLFKPQH